VKEWIYQLLWERLHLVRSPGSYNSQIGVPLSVLRMNASHQLAIIEAGISQPGEMEHLQRIIRPDVGIFTSIGNAHTENFESQTQLIQEKLNLFESASTIIFPKDQPLLSEQIHQRFGKHKHLVYWSEIDDHAFVKLQAYNETEMGTLLHLICRGELYQITLPFKGRWAIENAMIAATFMLWYQNAAYLDVQQFAKLQAVAMRMELKPGINQCLLLNDSYNADIHSLDNAFNLLLAQTGYKKQTVILSDILQSTHNKAEMYQNMAHMMHQLGINRFVGIGHELKAHSDYFGEIPECYFVENTGEAADLIKTLHFEHEAILIKGARLFALERIVALLEEKKNGTQLIISTEAVIHNLNVYRSILHKEVKTMVMVKALSYGSGLSAIARILEYQRVNYLGVALADEGVELRKAGIGIPIIVMNPSEDAFATMVSYKLEPALYDSRKASAFGYFLRKNNIAHFPVHVKIDTGMNRLGFKPSDMQCLYDLLLQFGEIHIQSAFSHLAASEDPLMDAFTQEQIQQFSAITADIMARTGYRFIRHILNSAGIERFPNAQFDMVRLGIGLYGVSVHLADKLKPISRLSTIISQIKTIDTNETVGYNRRGTVNRTSRIAVVPIGYADGLNRKLGNGNWKMLVHNQWVPTIGNICMDMTMLDITDIPAEVGDEVVVFGTQPTVYQMAAALQTIPYEILTGISGRVKRIYMHED